MTISDAEQQKVVRVHGERALKLAQNKFTRFNPMRYVVWGCKIDTQLTMSACLMVRRMVI